MKKTGWEVGANLVFWLLTGWFIVTTFSVTAQEVTVESNGFEHVQTIRNANLIHLLIFNLVVAAAVFYGNLYLITRLKNSHQLLRTILYSVGTLVLALLISYVLPPYMFPTVLATLPFPLLLSLFFFYYTVSGGYGIAKVWWTTETQRQQLALEKKQAELNLLRLQLHPHFLFNVLNNLLSMVDQRKNPKMAETIDRLSGMLRYVVYETEQDRVALEKEIHFIRNYATLQLMRFEQEEVDFALEVQGEHRNQTVVPGIFVPFIENAFKHGVRAETRSFVAIHFDLRQSDRISFCLRNSLHAEQTLQENGGTGLAASRKRLALAYPDRHRLEVSQDHAFFVKLELLTA